MFLEINTKTRFFELPFDGYDLILIREPVDRLLQVIEKSISMLTYNGVILIKSNVWNERNYKAIIELRSKRKDVNVQTVSGLTKITMNRIMCFKANGTPIYNTFSHLDGKYGDCNYTEFKRDMDIILNFRESWVD